MNLETSGQSTSGGVSLKKSQNAHSNSVMNSQITPSLSNRFDKFGKTNNDIKNYNNDKLKGSLIRENQTAELKHRSQGKFNLRLKMMRT